jgi:hypothetical protein
MKERLEQFQRCLFNNCSAFLLLFPPPLQRVGRKEQGGWVGLGLFVRLGPLVGLTVFYSIYSFWPMLIARR